MRRETGKVQEPDCSHYPQESDPIATQPSAAVLLCQAVADLAAQAVSTPRLDAEVLLAHALGIDRAGLYARLHKPVPGASIALFRQLLRRRAQHEPLPYITGIREFWSLDFAVDSRVLIPRPETEVVVEVALQLLRQSPLSTIQPAPKPRLIDLGTGSGCIAIVLAKELPQAEIWAIDASAGALAVARNNARRHGVAGQIRFLLSDLFAAIPGETDSFDLIVSNPPYIARDDLPTLPAEVRDWEPHSALDGGIDGLDFYRRLLREGPVYLRSGGWLVLEIGHGQSKHILPLIQERGDLIASGCVQDYAGRERVILASKA